MPASRGTSTRGEAASSSSQSGLRAIFSGSRAASGIGLLVFVSDNTRVTHAHAERGAVVGRDAMVVSESTRARAAT